MNTRHFGCVQHDCEDCINRPRNDIIKLMCAFVSGMVICVLLFIPSHQQQRIELSKARTEGIQEGAKQVALKAKPLKLSDFNAKEVCK